MKRISLGLILAYIGIGAALAVVGFVTWASIYGYTNRPGWVGVADKELWNWLELLIVPFVLGVGGGIGGYLLTRSENRNAQAIENQRRQSEQAIADQRTQDDAIQAYFEYTGQLLLDRDLRNSLEDDDLRLLIRARTLTLMEGLDSRHMRSLLSYLYEADLIHESDAIVRLDTADFSDLDLHEMTLIRTNLGEAVIRHTNLREANLSVAHWRFADLTGADLTGAMLQGIDLFGAILQDTCLADAQLTDAILTNADLTGSDLTGSDLTGANLVDADLTNANLSGTNLTADQLDTCKSLVGAIMPDGSQSDKR